MSNSDEFATIDLTSLAAVAGGVRVRGRGRIEIGPGSGTVEGEVEYDRSNYESCLDRVTRRPGWTPRQLVQACGRPPA